MSEKKKRRSLFHPSKEDGDGVRNNNLVISSCTGKVASSTSTSLKTFLALILLCMLIHSSMTPWFVRAERLETETGPNNTCNDNVPKVRVPQDCTLVMAPSGIDNSGWGVFTLIPLKKGERVLDQGKSTSILSHTYINLRWYCMHDMMY